MAGHSYQIIDRLSEQYQCTFIVLLEFQYNDCNTFTLCE